MFGRKKAQPAVTERFYTQEPPQLVAETAPTPEPTAPARPEPSAIALEMAEDTYSEYSALAEKIGLDSPAITRQRVLRFLQREEIPLFDNERVAGFMDRLVRDLNGGRDINVWMQTGYQWVWRALRSKDGWEDSGLMVNGLFTGRLYGKPVPIDALRTVDRIATEFPAAKFYVTDYEVTKPDPFLCFRFEGSAEHFVVAVWDEPGFKASR